MSAVFEVSLLYKKRVSLCEVINNINSTRFSCDIEKIEVIDNWQYENERIIRKNEFNQIQRKTIYPSISNVPLKQFLASITQA